MSLHEAQPESRDQHERLQALLSLQGLTAARVSDTLDEMGHRHQVMEPIVRPLRRGPAVIGRAVTVGFVPATREADPEDPYSDAIDLIDGLRPGDFVVIATNGDHRSAYWGQLFSAAARGHGAVGVVCDGYVRDTPEIAELGFPVFAQGNRPIDFRNRMQIESVGSTVSCAGVETNAGDLVIADDDGVVVVPQLLAAEVTERVSKRAGTEATVLDELLAGASLREVWSRHRVL